jgi:hypothetical protein
VTVPPKSPLAGAAIAIGWMMRQPILVMFCRPLRFFRDVDINIERLAFDGFGALLTSFHIMAEVYDRIRVPDALPPCPKRAINLDCDVVALPLPSLHERMALLSGARPDACARWQR